MNKPEELKVCAIKGEWIKAFIETLKYYGHSDGQICFYVEKFESILKHGTQGEGEE